jgi:hypothetical protein
MVISSANRRHGRSLFCYHIAAPLQSPVATRVEETMIFAAYIPSWSGAIEEIFWQSLLFVFLGIAIFSYARHRYGSFLAVIAPIVGLTLSIGIGLNFAWAGWDKIRPGLGDSPELIFKDRTCAFFELGNSAIVGAAGLVIGELILECYGLIARYYKTRPASQS